MDRSDAVPRRPDRLPRFRLVAHRELLSEVDVPWIPQLLHVEPVRLQARCHEVGVHAGDRRGVDDFARTDVAQHLLVLGLGVRLFRRDEAGSHVRKVGPHRDRGRGVTARRDSPGEDDRPVPEVANLGEEPERVERPRVSAGAAGDENQPVDPRLDRFSGVSGVRNVVEDDAAVRMDSVDDLGDGAERRDDQRDPLFDADLEVRLDPWVRAVDDQVHAVRDVPDLRDDLVHPLAEPLRRAVVERRERSGDPGFARCDDELGARHQKHGSGDDREAGRVEDGLAWHEDSVRFRGGYSRRAPRTRPRLLRPRRVLRPKTCVRWRGPGRLRPGSQPGAAETVVRSTGGPESRSESPSGSACV